MLSADLEQATMFMSKDAGQEGERHRETLPHVFKARVALPTAERPKAGKMS